MAWKNLVIYTCIAFCLIGCSSLFKNYYTNDEGGNRPKQAKFTLNNPSYNLQQEDLIDKNAVYVNTSYIYYGGKTHTDYHYLRFFKNGRYTEDLVSKKEDLTVSTFNKVNNALMIGYFTIENNDYLNLEYFRVKYGEGGFYDKRQGFVKNDSIFLYYGNVKNNNFPSPTSQNCRVYVKREVADLQGTPDW